MYSDIEKNPIKFINNSSQKDIEKFITTCSDYYYNSDSGETLVSDQTFDFIKDFLEKKYPNSKVINQIGSNIKKDKVKLPFHMGSMNKKKTEKEINKWINDYPGEVLISDKLDGISFLLSSYNGIYKIYTRGNGTYGKDITEIQNFVSLPKSKDSFVVRGEILVSKKNYEKVKGNFSNPRSFVAGMSNQKDFSKKKDYLKLLDFVCYEFILPEMKPEDQMKNLKKIGFQTVNNLKSPKFDFPSLSEYMLERKKKSIYEIDGLIITQNKKNSRNTDGNPKYSFAFKMDLEFAITKVINVEWNASKHGKLKPIVNIEPTVLCGTTNRKATGNNADFIVKNGIGPGAVVKMIKGGEIIPKIVEVLEKKKPQMPNVEYIWNETHKEIILINMEEDNSVKIKRIITFFKTLEVENIGPGLYQKIYEAGFNTIKKIMNIKVDDLLKLDGIKEKSANKIYTSIHNVIDKEVEIEKVIAGSSILDSVGYKILKKITDKYPNIFNTEMEISTEMLNEIPSIQEKTSLKILEKLDGIRLFIKEHNELKIVKKKRVIKIKKDLGPSKNIVITGKRFLEVISKIEKKNWNIQSAVNSKTDILIVESKDTSSSKMKKAEELGITILSNDEFLKIVN